MEKLTKAQKKALQKSEWQKEAEKAAQKEQLKKLGLWGGLAVLVAGAILALAIFVNSSPSTNTSTPNANIPASTNFDFEKGPKTSKATLIEYGDFQCPACAAAEPMIEQLLKDEPNLHFVYRYFPLENIHQNAEVSARSGYAANVQGKFSEMKSMLFENQQDWAESTNAQSIFVSYAQKLGLDTNKFLSDMNSDAAKKFVADSLNQAVSAGLDSTPSFFLNGKRINPTSYDDLKKQIDNALAN